MASIEIKLAVVVGDNGKYSADAYRGEETDWGFLADSVGIWDEITREMIYPNVEKRYIVTTHVEIPEIEEVVTVAVEDVTP